MIIVDEWYLLSHLELIVLYMNEFFIQLIHRP